jgi:hypothetical protein
MVLQSHAKTTPKPISCPEYMLQTISDALYSSVPQEYPLICLWKRQST